MAQDIQIVQVDPITRRVFFKVSSRLVSGRELLTQIVVLTLLNSPGRDVLDPDDGAGIPDMIGMNIDATDTTEVLAEVGRRIRKAQTEIINAQTGLDLPPEEKLRELFVVGFTPGGSVDEVLVTIRVVNEAGGITDVTV